MAHRPPLPQLPALEALPALREALARQGRAVFAAPPGSGKTTLLPLALLDEPWLRGRRILMLEPRRVAARASAARMAALLGEALGDTVGYRIRFERRVSAKTRIEVITEGLLTRRLQADPELPGVGLVIFDEFHERSLDVDLALALTLDARAAINPELRVLVMSATLDTARVAALLDEAPLVEAGGRQFPVELRYRPATPGADLGESVAAVASTALDQSSGDVLAFLPGAREIQRARRRLEAASVDALICPLYGELSSAEQEVALQPAAGGGRKIILATNIAQTSLTVEGVNTVVDGGYARVARFDLGSGANRLETLRISRASAEQRAGRAGRLGPGVAWRLWSADQHAALPAHDTPEILSADLSRFALELAAWGVSDPARLPWLDGPPAVRWNYARELLERLGAIDTDGRITPQGRRLLAVPAAPRLAHMLHASPDRATAAWVAALLDGRGAGPVDLELRLREAQHGPGSARLRDGVRQLMRQGEAGAGPDDRPNPAWLGLTVAQAFPERIARRREAQDGVFLCADGAEARLPAGDALARTDWLAIAHWDPAPPRRIRLAAILNEVDARSALPPARTRAVYWDVAAQAVVAEERELLGAIVLSAKPLGGAAGNEVGAAMVEGIRRLGIDCLPWTEASRQWQARVESLRRWRPDEDWPMVDDASLLDSLDDWLLPYLSGMSRREHLARLDLRTILESRLDYSMQQALLRLAPTGIPVPSGSRPGLEYFADGASPVLAVKLQEMFGGTETPRVNDGRTPVSLHLLSPARRPVAVTQDLAGFWLGAYHDVRKDLRGRYPRHPWPEDPLAANPTARAKPRGT